jgi:DNA-binding transcriptional ArsR family regulator
VGVILRRLRVDLLSRLGEEELCASRLARRLGKTERTVYYMLQTLKSDGCVTVRPLDDPRTYIERRMKLWKATGNPVPDAPTRIERRSKERRAHTPCFDATGLAKVW